MTRRSTRPCRIQRATRLADIDSALVRQLIVDLVGEHRSIQHAEQQGVYVVPVRDKVIELCLPYGNRCMQRLFIMPEASRVDVRDLEQAAAVGICEAVANYDVTKRHNGRPIAITTHLYVWVRKHVFETVWRDHWSILKPSKRDFDTFVKDGMSPEERTLYNQTVLAPVTVMDVSADRTYHDSSDWYIWHDREQLHK